MPQDEVRRDEASLNFAAERAAPVECATHSVERAAAHAKQAAHAEHAAQPQGLDHALAKCHSQGMRISRQRRYILELLWKTREHLTAREIYDRLNREGYEIGHTSVYQNLEALSSQRIIECVDRANGRLYGSLSNSHSHVTCLDTDQILDVQVELPADLIEEIEQRTGVRIVDYRIDFFGHRR